MDGSLLPALPRMAWALWLDDGHRAAKMHVHFEVLRGIPVRVTRDRGQRLGKRAVAADPSGRDACTSSTVATPNINCSKTAVAPAVSSSAGLGDNAVGEAVEERPVSAAAGPPACAVTGSCGRAVNGVRRRCGSRCACLEVATGKQKPGPARGAVAGDELLGAGGGIGGVGLQIPPGGGAVLAVVQVRAGPAAPGERGPGRADGAGVRGPIANLLLALWAGKKPTKRTFEMFCSFFRGWATAEELQEHLERLKEQRGNSS